MRKKRPAPYVKGSPEFLSFLSGLNKEDSLYEIYMKARTLLLEDLCAGIKIERRKFPKEYVRKYGLTNLWKLNLPRNHRLTYTIIAERGHQIPVILELLDHPTYDRRFGYRSD